MPKINDLVGFLEGHQVLVIAEIGVNHNGDVVKAKQLIDAACNAGADAVKFQMFQSDELVTAWAPKADYQKATTGTTDNAQLAMLKELELTREEHLSLLEYCESKGVTYICTPYDVTSATYLAEKMMVAALKVASSDTTNIPFLRELDGMGRPVILSTGMCTMNEVRLAVEALSGTRARGQLYLLQCTSDYPAPLEAANLRVMKTMADEFGCIVGYSDHTLGTEAAVLSVACGARLVEKHFTLDRDLPGPDHRASSEPMEFSELVSRIRQAEIILGSPEKNVTKAEQRNKVAMQKSIYYRGSMSAGRLVTLGDLAFKRPAGELHPSDADSLLGRVLVRDVLADEPVRWADFAGPSI